MSSVPRGWTTATIEQLAGMRGLAADGDWIESKDQDPHGEVRLIQLADIGDGEFRNRSSRFVTSATVRRLNCTLLQDGDLLIARMPDPLGRACVFPNVGQPAITAVDIFIWRGSPDGPVARWLMHFVNSTEVRNRIAEQAGGTTRQRISGGRLKQLTVHVPPLAEQRRIVAKIDSLSAKSRRARNHLDHLPQLVEKYKKSILGAAFRGELLGGGRHNTVLTPLNTLCTSVTDGDHQAPPRADDGIPFITISAMNNGVIDLRKATRFVPRSYFEQLKPTRRAAVDDILYSVTGSFGISAIVEGAAPFVFQRHIAIFKPDRSKTVPRFLYRMLSAPQVMEQAVSVATGTAQLTVPLSSLREFLVPSLSLEEQGETVRRIETAFAWIDRLASEAVNARRLIGHLDQTVLTKAFRGELVPQDPNDEPASSLLDDIRAERSGHNNMKRASRTRGHRAVG